MRTFKLFSFIAIACIVILTGCKFNDYNAKSQGAPYEIVVVAPGDLVSSPVMDTLFSVLRQPVPVLTNYEPMFDVSVVGSNNFSGILQRHRNILMIMKGSDYPNASMTVQYDVNASPQIFVYLTGPDNQSIIDYIGEHQDELISFFEITERDRSIALNAKFNDIYLEKAIKDKFGFDIKLNKGYTIRNQEDNFMWISLEYPTASQGIVIYDYPYESNEDFTAEKLIEKRNEFVSLIPGPLPNSYMTTYPDYLPEPRYIRIHNRPWVEMRGFWEVANDFMGGTFVSFTTWDRENGKIVTIDFYVYSPEKPKRNYMKMLEHLIYSVRFPRDGDAE